MNFLLIIILLFFSFRPWKDQENLKIEETIEENAPHRSSSPIDRRQIVGHQGFDHLQTCLLVGLILDDEDGRWIPIVSIVQIRRRSKR